MHLKTYEYRLMEFPHYAAHKWLLLYVPPILLAIGVVGNVLSFIILTRRAMRKVSTYTYLAVLSIVDTLVLLLGLLRLWVGELTGTDLRDIADWACRSVNAIGYTISDYAVWLIVAVTVERFIAVCYPLRAHSMCNRSRAIIVMVALWILLFLINFHNFFTLTMKENKIKDEYIWTCDPDPKFEYLHNEIWIWVDAIIYSLLPFIVLGILNSLIIHKVIVAKRTRSELSENSPASSNRRSHGESSTKLTIMLLTVSFAFLITTLPMNITLILTTHWNSMASASKDSDVKYELYSKGKLVRTITELMMYANHSMNFFLYCATGQKFRQQLLMLCGCWRRRPAMPTSVTHWHSEATHGGVNKRPLTASALTTFTSNGGSSSSGSNKKSPKPGLRNGTSCGPSSATKVKIDPQLPATPLSSVRYTAVDNPSNS